jgi:hypothetical protein
MEKKNGDFVLHCTETITKSLEIARELRDAGYWTQLVRAEENRAEIYRSLWKKELEYKYGIPKFNEETVALEILDRLKSGVKNCPRCGSLVKNTPRIEDTDYANRKSIIWTCQNCNYIFSEGIQI